jgi:hypothetical protein
VLIASSRGFDSLFVKLLATPALLDVDYAAAQRVEIVASKKYTAVLEATCNFLFGIKYDFGLRFLCFTKGAAAAGFAFFT